MNPRAKFVLKAYLVAIVLSFLIAVVVGYFVDPLDIASIAERS